MGDDNQLRVVITVDPSQVAPGMQSAASTIQSSAQTIAQAQNVMATATRNLADAQVELGAAAAAGNAEAAQIIAEYQAQAREAAVAVQELTASTEASVPAFTEQAAAAGRASAAIGSVGISSRQAATAGIGILEGRMMSGNRAAAAFLSTTLGLGPVLQAAFPVIGALALGEVLIDIGKALYKFGEDAREIGQELGGNWLDGAILQLEGFGGELKKQEKNIAEFHAQFDESTRQLKEQAFQTAGERGGPGEEAAARGAAAQQQADGLRSYVALLQQQLNTEKQLSANADKSVTPKSFFGTAEVSLADREEGLKAREQAKETQALIDAATRQISVLEGEVSAQALKASDAGTPKDATAKAVKPIKDDTLKNFVEECIEDQRRLAEASARGTDAITAAGEEQLKAQAEAVRKKDEADSAATEDWKKRHEEEITMVRQEAEAEIGAAQDAYEATERDVKLKESLGIISHHTAEQMLLDAEKLKAQTTQGALGKEQGLFDPNVSAKELREFTQIENRMTAEARKAAAERQKIVQQETMDFIQKWKKVENTFNQDFTSAFNQWATKSKSAEQAFGHMFGEMELQLVDFVAKWLLQKAEMWAMDEAMQLLGITKERVQQGANNVAQVTGAASTGAALAAAAAAPGGPPAMAAAAASATGIIESVGSAAAFDTGGMLPHMGFAFNQSGSPERILSPSQTHNFESLVNNGGSRSASLHQTNNFGGGVTPEMLNDHTQKTMAQLRRMIRPEALA